MPSSINSRCTACDLCRQVCPSKSIIPIKKQYFIDFDTCCDEQLCIEICPEDAIVNAPRKEQDIINMIQDLDISNDEEDTRSL